MELAAFERLEEKIDGLLNRLQETREENQRLRDQLQERDTQVAELSHKVEGHQQAMDSALADKEQQLVELKEQLASRDSQRQEVRKRIEQLVLKLETA